MATIGWTSEKEPANALQCDEVTKVTGQSGSDAKQSRTDDRVMLYAPEIIDRIRENGNGSIMGDGRYYTWLQFTQTVYYTILCIVLVIDIVYLNTKSRKRRTLKYLLIIKGLVLIMTVFRVYEALIFTLEAARVLRQLQMLAALILFTLIIQVFYRMSYRYSLIWIGLWFSVIAGNMLLFDRNLLIDAYPDYGIVEYHWFYRLLVAVMVVLTMTFGIRHMAGPKDISRYDLLQKRYISMALIVPSAFYVLHIFGLSPENVQIFYGLLIISSLILLWVFIRYTPGELLPTTFSQLVEDIRETVLLFDAQGQIIYNNSTELAKQLNLNQLKCDNCYQHIFRDFRVIESRESDLETRVELEQDGTRYFLRCRQKEIVKGEKVLGYLMVIEDLTHLETMLRTLTGSTEELESIHESLKEHAAIVATVEAERERNRLMLEVQNYLGHRFAELAKVIENIIGSTDTGSDEQIIYEIQSTIELAKENLSDIRSTVVDYRSSYDKSYVGR